MVSTSGKCILYVKNKVVFFEVEDGDISSKEVIGSVEKKSDARSLFSANYMRDIFKQIKDISVKIDCAVDHPLRVTAEKNDCKIEFLLAPRIEAD